MLLSHGLRKLKYWSYVVSKFTSVIGNLLFYVPRAYRIVPTNAIIVSCAGISFLLKWVQEILSQIDDEEQRGVYKSAINLAGRSTFLTLTVIDSFTAESNNTPRIIVLSIYMAFVIVDLSLASNNNTQSDNQYGQGRFFPSGNTIYPYVRRYGMWKLFSCTNEEDDAHRLRPSASDPMPLPFQGQPLPYAMVHIPQPYPTHAIEMTDWRSPAACSVGSSRYQVHNEMRNRQESSYSENSEDTNYPPDNSESSSDAGAYYAPI